MDENRGMDVSSSSSLSGYLSLASSLQSQPVAQQIAVAITKQIQDQQKQQAQAIVEMMRQMPGMPGVGENLDIRA